VVGGCIKRFEMGIMDAVTVLAIFGAFMWLILVRLNKKSPQAIQNTIQWFKSTTGKKPDFPTADEWKQKYEEKRSIM